MVWLDLVIDNVIRIIYFYFLVLFGFFFRLFLGGSKTVISYFKLILFL